MGLESFYGGRQGASFIIVKRFDAISIEENSTYKLVEYAIDTNGTYYYDNVNGCFIEKNGTNFNNYIWQWTQLDGSTVTTIDVNDHTTLSEQTLGIAYQEGMVECFSKGGDSTDIVNYGEYVIIDTPVKDNPDNGKVYRRGMNYDYDPINNPLAGAEYIGQIVGPRGQTPKVQVDHYDDIVDDYGITASERSYTVTDDDIVPGSWEENGIRQFRDNIDYVYATMIDALGNVIGCAIGFKVTTLVMNFEARSISPYTNREIDDQGRYYNDHLIIEDPDEYINGKWIHPFYEKWQIKVPHGYHGINSTNIEIIPSLTMPAGFKENFDGAGLYTDAECTVPYEIGGSQVKLAVATPILRDADYDVDPAVISAMVLYGGVVFYVKKEDCYMDIVRYRETNFDEIESGEVTYYEVGNFNSIERITISEEGILTVYYRGKRDPQPLDNVNLRWIDTVDSDGITVDNAGTITIFYNTKHLDPVTGLMVHDTQVYPNVVKWIDGVSVETTDSSGIEGTGDQKLRITYNVPDPNDPTKNLVQVIDDPLNYIIESVVSVPTTAYPNAPYWHLLVYYSDPALRASMSSKWVTYPSEKYPGTVWNQWVDLGTVKGEPAGLHILKKVTSMNELKDGSGNWIPPEQLADGSGVILRSDAAGWSCILEDTVNNTYTYLFYDYEDKLWFPGTSVDPSSVDPTYVIDKSVPTSGQVPATGDVPNLKTNGFWFAVEQNISVK